MRRTAITDGLSRPLPTPHPCGSRATRLRQQGAPRRDSLDDVRPREAARVGGIAHLDLERHMLDTESLMQFFTGTSEERIVIRDGRDDEMRGEGRLRCTHRPDMEVVHLRYVG